MGFNFGAMLGGAADQIVKDIDTQEKEVKLRTRTILDRQIAETAASATEVAPAPLESSSSNTP